MTHHHEIMQGVPMNNDWPHGVDWRDLTTVVASSAAVGMIRLGYLIQRGRAFRIIDLLVDPSMAVLAGVIAWSLADYSQATHQIQLVGSFLASWAGPDRAAGNHSHGAGATSIVGRVNLVAQYA